MMRTPTARQRTVDPWSPLCGVTGEVRRLAPLARIVTKRRPDEPAVRGSDLRHEAVVTPTPRANTSRPRSLHARALSGGRQSGRLATPEMKSRMDEEEPEEATASAHAQRRLALEPSAEPSSFLSSFFLRGASS